MRPLIIVALLLAAPAHAVLPDEMLSDPVQEARARDISKDLRCVVCQNQSIDDSDAPLAKDLRIVVREQIRLGRSNDEIITYVSDRYGDFVLLKPPLKPTTWLLWAGPFILLLAGAAGLIAMRRRPAPLVPDVPLSDDEAQAIADITDSKS